MIVQRLAQPLRRGLVVSFLDTSLSIAGLPCVTVLQSLTAVAGETIKDQVHTCHVH